MSESNSSTGFSGRLSEAMKSLRIRQVDIAEKTGLSASYVNAVVKGRRPPSDRFTKGLFDHFGIRGQWLVEGEGPMVSPLWMALDHRPIPPEEKQRELVESSQELLQGISATAQNLMLYVMELQASDSLDKELVGLMKRVIAKCSNEEKGQVVGFMKAILLTRAE